MADKQYEAAIQHRDYIDMDKGYTLTAYVGVVLWPGDDIPAGVTASSYDSEATAWRQAGRLRAKFQAYYDRTARRWELEQRDKSMRREISAVKKRARLGVLTDYRERMFAELIAAGSPPIVTEIDDKIREAEAKAEEKTRRSLKAHRKAIREVERGRTIRKGRKG